MKRLIWVSAVLGLLLASVSTAKATPAPSFDDQVAPYLDLDDAHSSLEQLKKKDRCGTCKCKACRVEGGKYKCERCKCKSCNDAAGKRPCKKCKCGSCYTKKGKYKCHHCKCKKCR